MHAKGTVPSPARADAVVSDPDGVFMFAQTSVHLVAFTRPLLLGGRVPWMMARMLHTES